MSPQCGRDGGRSVERAEFGFLESDSVPVLQRENDLHMLERIPSDDVRAAQLDCWLARCAENSPKQRAYVGLGRHRRGAHRTTSVRIAGGSRFADTASNRTSTMSVTSLSATSAYCASHRRAGALRGPVRGANTTRSGLR